MITFKEFVAEETKPTPLHTELKSLGQHYHEPGGSSSETRTYFRGPKNDHFDKIHKMMTDRGYKKVHSSRDGTEYHKKLDNGKQTATAVVTHDGKHVYRVGTLTYRNHY